MKRRLVSYGLCLVVLVCGLLLSPLSSWVSQVAEAQTTSVSRSAASRNLSTLLLNAVRNAKFAQVIDYGPYSDEVCPGAEFCTVPARQTAYTPNVDVAVIQLDKNGRAVGAANVILSRDYPDGVSQFIDRDYATRYVRWRKWDIDRWNGGTFSNDTGEQLTLKGWTDNPPFTKADDIISGREAAPYQFMLPYPASLFKILVAFRVMRLVDMGKLSLDQNYTYSVSGETRLLRDWMDPMITYSDNESTRALLKLLHDLNQVTVMNNAFRDLGLGTLQINGTDPTTGGNWQPGQIHLTAMDTARLLWLIDGADSDRRVLWTRPNGQPVTPALLSPTSRAYLKGLLANQGFNEVLSTSNFCGAPNTLPGIPSLVPTRWIDPTDGTVTVDGIPYGQDVQPCNATAEVTFAHKTGLTFNYGSDAGIVQALPGKGDRRYIIAFIANLGYRYTDPVFASRTTTFPCFDAVGGICYTQRIPAMAKQIDDGLKRR
jgi:hypothetical protein